MISGWNPTAFTACDQTTGLECDKIHRSSTLASGGFDGETPIIHEQSAVLVVDGVVAKIGDADDLAAEQPDAEPIGSGQDLVIPGLINAHHHVGLTPFQLGSVDHPLELWLPVAWDCGLSRPISTRCIPRLK